MGQYYIAVNVDKKEYLTPHSCHNGAKLMEFSYIVQNGTTNKFISTLNYLMTDKWKNDRVYIVGDYANEHTTSIESESNWLSKFIELKNELGFTGTLYDFAEINFKEVEPKLKLQNYITAQYLCNSERKEYINLRNLPKSWKIHDYKTKKEMSVGIYPLPLLICMGNGRGGGDFDDSLTDKHVGEWVETSNKIFFSIDKPEGYTEYPTSFKEEY